MSEAAEEVVEVQEVVEVVEGDDCGDEEDDVQGPMEGMPAIPSINAIINELNSIMNNWNGIYKPLNTNKRKALKFSNMSKVPGANVNHVLLGLPMAIMACSDDISVEGLKKMVVFDFTNFKEPVKIVGNQADQVQCAEAICQWCVGVGGAIPKIA